MREAVTHAAALNTKWREFADVTSLLVESANTLKKSAGLLAQLGGNNQALMERNATLEQALPDEKARSRQLQEELATAKNAKSEVAHQRKEL